MEATLTKNYTDKIGYVLDGFDFEKVHAYMLLTKWTWHNSEGDRIPSIDDLKITAENLLWKITLSDQNISLMGTGGFYVYRFEYGIKLSFEPFRSSSF